MVLRWGSRFLCKVLNPIIHAKQVAWPIPNHWWSVQCTFLHPVNTCPCPNEIARRISKWKGEESPGNFLISNKNAFIPFQVNLPNKVLTSMFTFFLHTDILKPPASKKWFFSHENKIHDSPFSNLFFFVVRLSTGGRGTNTYIVIVIPLFVEPVSQWQWTR